jgi:hypothetical protein
MRAAAAVLRHMPLLPVAIVCTAVAAVVVFALTGNSLPVLPARWATIAPHAAVAVATATAGGDIVMLASLPSLLDRAPPVVLVTIAVVASLARLVASAWWARQRLITGSQTPMLG